jgi:hypothetical protein
MSTEQAGHRLAIVGGGVMGTLPDRPRGELGRKALVVRACVHRAAGAAEADGVQCLHLIAVPRPAPGTKRLVSPDLACGRVPVI